MPQPFPDEIAPAPQVAFEFNDEGDLVPKKVVEGILKLSTLLKDTIHYPEIKDFNPELKQLIKSFENLLEEVEIRPPAPPPIKILERNADTLIGIEIEAENSMRCYASKKLNEEAYITAQKNTRELWSFKADGSLRGHGIEYVSRVGLKAKDAPSALHLLNLFIFFFHSKLALNARCGVHVHVNVREFSVEQLLNFASLYILFEDTFYKISGNRQKSIFCVPIRASGSNIEALFKFAHLKRSSIKAFRLALSYYKKYMAFNLRPLCSGDSPGSHGLGTIEFRHHKGECRASQLIPWIQTILDLHYAAQQYTFEDLTKIIFKLNTYSNYLQFAKSIFSTLPVTQDELVADMYEGSAFLKEVYLISKGE